ncbi:MAG: hypothetical protein PHH00_02135 [Candidatus Nanoarchaeia archaeon]|nr:hypothetical protein [Candidatus Nanoarchaeia archaeon]
MGKFFRSKGHKVAMAVGLFIASMHALWAIVVALGMGQVYLNWILPLHFIDNLYTVLPFNFLTALLLVVVAFVAGYLTVWLFMGFWKLMKLK